MKVASSLILLFGALVAAASPSTITVHAWPLSATSPTPFATIAVSPISPGSQSLSAKVQSVHQPSVSQDELVRIGIYDASNTWTGVATSAKSFGQDISRKIVLHTDSEGIVSHIGFSAFTRAAGAEDVVVEVVPITTGPQPVLNKPVVLTPEGKVATPDAADQKTFLQK
jgi:hypothetical protein